MTEVHNEGEREARIRPLHPDLGRWFLANDDGEIHWEPSNPGGLSEGCRVIALPDPYTDPGYWVATVFYTGWPIMTVTAGYDGEYEYDVHIPVEDGSRGAQALASWEEQIGEAGENWVSLVAEHGYHKAIDEDDANRGEGHEVLQFVHAVAYAMHKELGTEEPRL